MSVDDDPAFLGLPEDLCEAGDRHQTGGDDVGEHLPRPDRRQLVDVADKNERGIERDGFDQRRHQWHVDHRRFVDHHDVGLQRLGRRALEAAGGRVDFQETMDGLRLAPGLIGHAAGGAAGRGGECDRELRRRDGSEQRLEQRRLANAGAAGDHRHLGAGHQRQRLALGRAEMHAFACFEVLDGRIDINPPPGRPPLGQCLQSAGDGTLEACEAADSQKGGAIDVEGFDVALGDRPFHFGGDGIGIDTEQSLGPFEHIGTRHGGVTVVGGALDGMGDTGPDAFRCGAIDAELLGDLVGAGKADATHLAGETVRVFFDQLHRLRSQHLPDGDGARSADTLVLEGDHHVLHRLALAIALGNAGGGLLAKARNGDEPHRFVLDDVERFRPEHLHDALGHGRPDPGNQTGAEKADHRVLACWLVGLDAIGAELQTMDLVGHPLAFGVDLFARCDRGRCPITATGSLRPRTRTFSTEKPFSSL